MTDNAAFWDGIAEISQPDVGAKAQIAFIVARKPGPLTG
jgi:hypothetical protein